MTSKFVRGIVVVASLVALLGVPSAFAVTGYGAQHGYVELGVADGDGNSGPYVVGEETQLWSWQNQQGEWASRSKTCTAVFTSGAQKGQCKTFTAFSAYAPTGNTNLPGTVGSACAGNAHDCTMTTGSGLGTIVTQYHWNWTCGNFVLLSDDVTTYPPITLWINASGSMESWMANKTFPESKGGKYSFSISDLTRVTAADWSVTKNGDPYAGGSLLGNLGLEGPDNYLFPPAHTGYGPNHGEGLYMNDIMSLDSTPQNDASGGNRASVMVAPSFVLGTDAAAYEVTVTMTIKDGTTGTSIIENAVFNLNVHGLDDPAPLPLCPAL